MARIKICKQQGCHDAATTDGYCRLHYLKHWRKIKRAQKRAAARKLNRYVEYVCKQNPDDFMDVIRKDLRSPQFSGMAEDAGSAQEFGSLFDDVSDEQEIERIVKKLKVEEGF